MTANKNDFVKIKEIFSNYITSNGQRKTPERYVILEEIYDRDDHIDAETLYLELNSKGHSVSRATVYNTLELLISCNLVVKHQFGLNVAQYEKAYGSKQHDHLICLECRKVVEFCDPRIYEIEQKMGELLKFNVSHHSLNLYGLCEACLAKNAEK